MEELEKIISEKEIEEIINQELSLQKALQKILETLYDQEEKIEYDEI